MRGLTAAAKETRRLGLGGSDAGRVMRGEWNQLWREKMNLAEPEDLTWTIPVQVGNCTERFNLDLFEHVTGRKVTRRGDRVASYDHEFMVANLDGVTTTSTGKGAYIDAKHVGRSDEAMVLRYTPQMTHCCAILGLDHWILSVLVGNSRHEIIEQPVDPFYMEELIEKEREFWGYIQRQEEPRDRTAPVLAPAPEKRLRNIDLGSEFGTPAWDAVVKKYNWAPELVPLIATFISTKAAHESHVIARDEIKRIVPDDVGELRRGAFLLKRNKAGAVTMTLTGE